ncbi:SoxZ [Achromatium sp. WMS3]|nr:SoxZ [Achromatium sp. WMS3]
MATRSTIKIRAKEKSGLAQVRSLINHPMETGLRKDKTTGELIPAHFIQELVAELNGNVVMTANWGVGISKNPYLSFNVKGGKKGDQIRLTWKDNKGNTDSKTATVV